MKIGPLLSLPALALPLMASGIANNLGPPEAKSFKSVANQTLPETAEPDHEWVFVVTPYIWFTGVEGTIRPFTGAPQIEIDKSASELLKDLDGAFFLAGYARRGELVLVGDFTYTDSSGEGTVPPGVPARGSFRKTSVTLLGGVQAIAQPKATLEVLGGLRYWTAKGGVDVPLAETSISPERSFTDFLIALRSDLVLGPQWSVLLYADVGLFSAGSDSTSQFISTINYQVNRDFFISLGYRDLNLDYRDGGTRLDVGLAGPIVGAAWRF